MTEENKTKIEDKKVAVAQKKEEKSEVNKEEKKEDGKAQKKDERPKKTEAVARGSDARISMKHSKFICKLIKGKKIDEAIGILEEVVKMKRPVPFTGEIPHRKGNIMAGRYPINASMEFILLLKGLKGNATTNGLDLERTRIKIASATWGRRPVRKGSRKAKRTNVILMAKEIQEKKK